MFDYLILGGGSAGCVLAARLSESPEVRVCLVEAGRDISASHMPDAIRSRYPGRAYLDARNIWRNLQARLSAPVHRYYEQARILGGGSAINALMANRGAPSDYDEWEALGAQGWRWETCLPYFKKLESDTDFAASAQDGHALHGATGPLRVQRPDPSRVSPFVTAVLNTLQTMGYPRRADQNGPWEDGGFVGAVAVSAKGERIPTSVCYLNDAVRQRPNLTIRTDWLVDRILFDDENEDDVENEAPQDKDTSIRPSTPNTPGTPRARGARLLAANGRQTGGKPADVVKGRTVIVCAGAVHSPAILLRSGIGPAAALRAMQIRVRMALEGVGGNLMEHPSIAVSAYLPVSARATSAEEHHEQGVIRYSSGLPGTVQGDMHGAILSRSGWHSIGQRLGTIFFWVNKSYSRGRLTLKSINPFDEPIVDFDTLSDVRDLDRLKQAVRFGAATLLDPAMKTFSDSAFPSSYSPRVAKVAGPGKWFALQRGLFSAMLDMAGPLRAMLIRRVVSQGLSLHAVLHDDAALTNFVRTTSGITWHPSGTCRMGRTDDPAAVTNPQGAVHGVQHLHVCDASLMPAIPCANLNVPTIMIAERIADMLKALR